MTIDSGLETAGIAVEIALVGLLVYRRAGRILPVFFIYCLWALLSDSASAALSTFFPARYGISFYLADTACDLVLQFCVLVEVAWSVLRPIRSRLSSRALLMIAGAILAVGAAIWPFAQLSGVTAPSTTWRTMMQLEQTASILRIVFFLLLAACSQFLSLGWRDRELQVATGFGFYSLVSIAVAVLNTHQSTALQFSHLYRVVALSFVGSLAYWTFSFARAEAQRRDFSPRMQALLLELAATARVTSTALADRAGAGKPVG